MKTIQSIFATFAIAAAVSPALAATDGLPPNLAGHTIDRAVSVEATTMQKAPQYLPGLGEVSLVPNPAFVAAPSTAPMKMGRVTPLRAYVGA